MSCVLRLVGDFDPKPVLIRTGWIDAAFWWRKGAIDRLNSPAKNSGIQIEVSDAPFDDLPGQVSDAIKFLNEELDSLSEIMNEVSVDSGVIDFGVAQSTHFAYHKSFPAQLVELAGRAGLGIDVSLYAVAGAGGFADTEPKNINQ